MSQIPYSAGPGGGAVRNDIDFGAFARAFEIAKKDALLFFVAGLLAFAPSFIISGIFQVITPRPAPGASTDQIMAMMGPMYGLMGINQLVSALVQGITSVAICSFCLGAIRNGRADLNDMFEGFKKFGPAMVAGLLVMLATLVGVLACCVGVFVAYALVLFTYAEIADGNRSPLEAMMASVELTKNKILPMIAFSFLAGLVTLAGVFACGIGIAFSFTVSMTALCLVYCDLTGKGPAGDTMAVNPISPYPRGQEMPQTTEPGTPYPPQDPPAPPSP